jgi:hypothetical protein
VNAVYWIAAAVALISAVEGGVELARDRSPVLTAWALSMAALSASLAVAAAVPVVMDGGSKAAASVSAALGIIGTWAFAEVLATTASDARCLADMVRTPLLGGTCAFLLLSGLGWAGSHDAGDAGVSELAKIAVELTMVAYYMPGLCRIAILAHLRAQSIPARWTRMAMRMVCASAGVELVLVMVRSAVLVAHDAGVGAGESAIPVISVLQGVAVICGVAGLAAGPVLMAISRRCALWFPYGRLPSQ